MKKLRIKEISINNKVVAIQIIEQTNRESDFGEGTDTFYHNGFFLTSALYPEAVIDNIESESFLASKFRKLEKNGLFVRGNMSIKDESIIPVFSVGWLDKLRNCVAEYNRVFSKYKEVKNEQSPDLILSERIIE